MNPDPVVYELSYAVASGAVHEFDAWLRARIAEDLKRPGFEAAEVFHAEGTDQSVTIIVQYTLTSRDALADFPRDEDMSARFPGVGVTDRVLQVQASVAAEDSPDAIHCMNCRTPLVGQYCAECGQRHRERMITVWELTNDLFRDLISWDSRLWRSVVPLLTRPGFLTREYLEGRRVRYTAPLRLYLALSIIFFLYIAIQAPLQELEEGITTLGNVELDAIDLDGVAEPKIPSAPDDTSEADTPDTPQPDVPPEEAGFDCDNLEINVDGDSLLDDPFVRERAKTACLRLSSPEGRRAFFRSLVDNIPAMLFLFLPLIALLGKFLYAFSRRYYVEHLLFFLHYHSFVFLLLLVAILTSTGLAAVGLAALTPWVDIFVTLYIGYYLYRALRRVYEQGRLLTITKQIVLTVAYVVGLTMTITIGALFTAATV